MESKSASGTKSSFMESPSKLEWEDQGMSMDMSTQGFAALDECNELLIYGANKNDESSFMNSGILNLLDTKDDKDRMSPAKEEVLPSERRPLLGLSKNGIGQRSRKRIREDSNSNKAGINNIQKITERFEASQTQLQNSSKTLRSSKLISTEGSSTTGGSKKAIAKRGPSGSSSSRKEQSFATQTTSNLLANQKITGIVSGVQSGKHSATMSRILESLNSKQHTASEVFKQALDRNHRAQLSPQDEKFEFQHGNSIASSDKFELEFTSDGNSGNSPADGVNSPIDHSGELKPDSNQAFGLQMPDVPNSNTFKGSSAHRSTKQLVGLTADSLGLAGSSNTKKGQLGTKSSGIPTEPGQAGSLAKVGGISAIKSGGMPVSFLSSSNVSSTNQSPQKLTPLGANAGEVFQLKKEDLKITPQNLTGGVMDSSQKAALMETIRSQKSKQSGASAQTLGLGTGPVGTHKDKKETREPIQAMGGIGKFTREPVKEAMTLERIIRHHSGAGDSKSPTNKSNTSKGVEGSRAAARKPSSGKNPDESKRKEGSNGPAPKESKRNGSTGVLHSGDGPAPFRKEYKLQTLDTLLKSKMHGQ